MIQTLVLKLITFYQASFAAIFGGQCRFYPSCSEYAKTAVRRRGVGRGLWLSLARLLKCHPFHPGGVDVLAE